MIKILERYIANAIFMATAIITLIITAIIFLLGLLGELKNIGEGDYGLFQAFVYVLLRLPAQLYQFSPMLILLGGIMGLSLLYHHRELIVMRASGFSIRRIIYTVLTTALLIVLAISLIGELLGPELSYKAEIRKENAQNAGQAVVTAAGIWFHIDNNFIHVERVVNRQLLEGVTRYQFDNEHHLQTAFYAKTLSFNHEWKMHDVVQTYFYPDQTKSGTSKEAPWDIKFNPNLLNVGLVDPSEMSLIKLAKFAQYLQQNGIQAREYQYDFWRRIFQPLASLVMMLLAIPFVLGALSTTTLGWRILVGIIVGFSFFILNAILGELCIVYQLPVLLAALFPSILLGLVGIFLTKRLIRH